MTTCTRPRAPRYRRSIGRGGVLVAAIVLLSLISSHVRPTAAGAAIPPSGADGAWSPLADWPINPIHASLTADGQLLTYGGTASGGQGGFLLDVWDPRAGLGPGSHETVAHNTNTNLFCSFSLSSADGADLLLFGGQNYNGNDADFAQRYRDGSLSALPDMNYARWYPTATTLPDGRVLVQGGAQGGYRRTPITTPEVFDGSRWIALTGAEAPRVFGPVDTFRWWYPRSWVTPAGKVFNIAQNQMYYLDPEGTGSIERLGLFPESAVGGTSASVMFDSGLVLQVGGGELNSDNRDFEASKQAVLIDLNFEPPKITRVADMNFPRHWATALVLPDGKVLVVGGSRINNSDDGVAYNPEMWDPATNSWTVLESNETMRLYHSTAVLLPNGAVFVGGGGSPGPVTNTNAELFYPPYRYDTDGNEVERLRLSQTPATVGYGETFTAEVSGQVERVSLIKTQNSTHAMNTQVFQELSFSQSGSQLRINAPAISTVATPGSYMLHALDTNGVPSPAQMIRVDGTGGSIPATPLPRADSIINGSFEGPNIKDGSFQARNVPGWKSSTNNRLEIWGSRFRGLTATEGNQVAQINVDGPTTIWQDIATPPGAVYEWSFDHRGAGDDDTVELSIGGSVVATHTTAASAWRTYRGTWTVPPGQTTSRFQLRGIDADSFSNMLDNVHFDQIQSVPPERDEGPFVDHDVPGTIEAEHYDFGGQRVGFLELDDNQPADRGNQYRPRDAVDIYDTVGDPGGYTVGRTVNGEWLEYTVDVPSAAVYDFGLNMATGSPTAGRIEVTVDGDVLGSAVPTSNDHWWRFTTVSAGQTLMSPGSHTIRLTWRSGSDINLDSFSITASGEEPTSGPFVDHQAPGDVQAEDYDYGGPGVAFNELDQTVAGRGDRYRPNDDVDIYNTVNEVGGYTVGRTRTGEWLEYTVAFNDADDYRFDLRIASGVSSSGNISLAVDGRTIGQARPTVRNDWWGFQAITVGTAPIAAGTHIIRLTWLDGGNVNLDKLTIARSID